MHRPAVPPAATTSGFTLLELLVVVGVVSVLLGISIGFLGRTDPERIAASVLAGELRAAQVTARAEGVPTEVWVRPGIDGAAATVQSRLLQAVATFAFEPGEPVLDDVLRPQLGGQLVPGGRFGHARRPVDGERAPLLQWALRPAGVELRDGFVVRLDLRLEQRRACIVLRLGQAAELRLDDELRPQAWLRLRTGGGATSTASIDRVAPLPLRRWCTLELACDGERAWIGVDGQDLGGTAVAGVPQQADDTALVVSPPEAPLPGLADEVRFAVFAFGPAQDLPVELTPRRVQRLAFDARGEPVGSTAVEFLPREERP
ncbi:MAG: prepilin-type N-terminal cleavage/methylation domain-containing protein [Planctomycetes bacterium]|nr:prepilin-type N-terminal cleavage/methylation domain-containing protein [Planctomycetota bacterium]